MTVSTPSSPVKPVRLRHSILESPRGSSGSRMGVTDFAASRTVPADQSIRQSHKINGGILEVCSRESSERSLPSSAPSSPASSKTNHSLARRCAGTTAKKLLVENMVLSGYQADAQSNKISKHPSHAPATPQSRAEQRNKRKSSLVQADAAGSTDRKTERRSLRRRPFSFAVGAEQRYNKDAAHSNGVNEENRGTSNESVNVYVRVRPPIQLEHDRGFSRCVFIKPGQKEISLAPNTLKERKFYFDHIFGEQTSQQDLFDFAGRPIVRNAFEGYNGTIFTYGQTGSGKTFTMMGQPETARGRGDEESAFNGEGLIPRILRDVFREAEAAELRGMAFSCSVSFLEIYNEKIRDLLEDVTDEVKNIREDLDRGVYVEGLKEESISAPKEAAHWLRVGIRNRSTGWTAMNRESSRSHSVFTLNIEMRWLQSTYFHEQGSLENPGETEGAGQVEDSGESESLEEEGRDEQGEPTDHGGFADHSFSAKTRFDGGRSAETDKLQDAQRSHSEQEQSGIYPLPELSITQPSESRVTNIVADFPQTCSAFERQRMGCDESFGGTSTDTSLSVEGLRVKRMCQSLRERGVEMVRRAQLHLIDLAGSERYKRTLADGERLKEATQINKSLSALGNVIMSLANKERGVLSHVHYRDSKLTFLLRDSLGGNAKTTMIATISPDKRWYNETLSTLKFAQRAKLMKNCAVVNQDVKGEVEALKLEIDYLRNELGKSLEREKLGKLKVPSPDAMCDESIAQVCAEAATAKSTGDGESSITLEKFLSLVGIALKENHASRTINAFSSISTIAQVLVELGEGEGTKNPRNSSFTKCGKLLQQWAVRKQSDEAVQQQRLEQAESTADSLKKQAAAKDLEHCRLSQLTDQLQATLKQKKEEIESLSRSNEEALRLCEILGQRVEALVKEKTDLQRQLELPQPQRVENECVRDTREEEKQTGQQNDR